MPGCDLIAVDVLAAVANSSRDPLLPLSTNGCVLLWSPILCVLLLSGTTRCGASLSALFRCAPAIPHVIVTMVAGYDSLRQHLSVALTSGGVECPPICTGRAALHAPAISTVRESLSLRL